MGDMKKTVVVLTCDSCGKEGAESARIATNTDTYRVDLCKTHMKDLIKIGKLGASSLETKRSQSRMQVYDL
jgi:hypothetical protein